MRAGVVLLLLGIATADPDGRVHGRVLDADGEPVPWAIVTAYCVTREEPLGRSAGAGKDGSYVIENLPPGEYVLEVGEPKALAEDTLVDAQIREWAEHTMRVLYAKDNPHRVPVGPGATVWHDVRRPRKVPLTVLFERDGNPLADVPVALRALDKEGLPRLTGPFDRDIARATDERGEITFPSVVEGSYVISLHIDDWEFRCRRIDVAGKEPIRIPVVLRTYRARIKVVDARGTPVTTAKPWLSEGGSLGVWSVDAEVSPSGVYTIPCLREGRYVPNVIAGGVRAKGQAFEIGPGFPDPAIVLPLPETGALSVRVVDSDGEPVRDATVEVEHSSGIPCLSYGTDRNGEVRVAHLTVGKWSVRRTGDEIPREVNVKPFAEARLTLPPLARGTLVVRVFGASGQSVPDQDIIITHSSGKPSYHRVTDQNGEIKLRLPVGKWVVTSPFMSKRSAEVVSSEEARVQMAYPY